MSPLDRREFLKTAGAAATAAAAGLPRLLGDAPQDREWIRQARIVIAEGYTAPFYPELHYDAGRAVGIVRDLGGDAVRFPSAGYYAFFPTRSGYPAHPELRGDPMRETLDLCRAQGLKTVIYIPLNHPFMNVTSRDPRYAGWTKRFADGSPMTTEHIGYGRFYEGCLNSPLRDVIRSLVREVAADYPADAVFFDGPYQGMEHEQSYCHCRYCEAAYRRRFGTPVPDQAHISREDEVRYTEWMAHDVVAGFLREMGGLVRAARDIPFLFNNTALLSRREWRSRAFPAADGFMYESAQTPEDKLFDLSLGRSTGKVIWTYVGSYSQYNREHLPDRHVRDWFSYPVEGQELLLDGAAAVAGGAGLLYWGLSRFYDMPKPPLEYPSGRYVRQTFDFEARNGALLQAVRPRPQAGILVGDQTIDWYEGESFVASAYANAYRGAFRLLKAHSHEAEPFLDWQMSAEVLARYAMIYAPNAVCLSDAQCRLLEAYVRGGGRLLATLLTSAADEHGRPRPNFGLAELFGARWLDPEPIESPDLYLQLPSGDLIPQDPQILRFEAAGGEVLAHTLDRGRRRIVGPALVRHRVGRGEVLYIGSSLDAVYDETLMEPIRLFMGGLFEPWLGPRRSYRVDFRPGLIAQFAEGDGTLLLHLLANTGNKDKEVQAREWYQPLADARARIRIPEGRAVRSVRLLRAGVNLPADVRGGWLHATVPELLVHEAVRVDLSGPRK